MKVILKEGFTFTPEWNGNKKKEKKDQITVDFEFLSGANISEAYNDDGKLDRLKDWLLICKKVNNLDVNGVPVTPEGLYTIKGLAELYLEVRTAYRCETVIDKKK